MTYAVQVYQAAAGCGDAGACPWNDPSLQGFGGVTGMEQLHNPDMFEEVGGLVYVSNRDGGHGPMKTAVEDVLRAGFPISVRQLSPTTTETILVGGTGPQVGLKPREPMLPGTVLLISVLGLDAFDEDQKTPLRTVLTTSPADVAAMAKPGAKPETMAILDGDPAIISAATGGGAPGVQTSITLPSNIKLGTAGTVAVVAGAAGLLYLLFR